MTFSVDLSAYNLVIGDTKQLVEKHNAALVAIQTAVNAAGLGIVNILGFHDASSGSYPAAPSANDGWIISVAGTISAIPYSVGDVIVYTGSAWVLVLRVFDRTNPGAIGGTTPGTITGTTITGTDTTEATSATAAAMKTAGGLAVAKKIYPGDNIVMAAGKGMDFGANGAGDRVMDDFQQEQTYTVTVTTTTGTVALNSTNNKLAYRVLGKEARIQGRFQIDSVTGPPTGNALISLPMASGNLSGLAEQAIGTVWLYNITGGVIVGKARIGIGESSSYMQIIDELEDGGLNTSIAGLFQAGTYVSVDISYFRS